MKRSTLEAGIVVLIKSKKVFWKNSPLLFSSNSNGYCLFFKRFPFEKNLIILFQCFHFRYRPIVSKLTMYISTENNSNIYHPIYLKSLTCQELINKVAPLIGLNASEVHSGFLLGPYNSQIIITDDLVRNVKEETLFLAEVFKGGYSFFCSRIPKCLINSLRWRLF